jgi:hypothetical protein
MEARVGLRIRTDWKIIHLRFMGNCKPVNADNRKFERNASFGYEGAIVCKQRGGGGSHRIGAEVGILAVVSANSSLLLLHCVDR